MEYQGPPIDWNALRRTGRVMELLHTLPRARWTEQQQATGLTLLHFAARSADVAALVTLIQSGGLDVNAQGLGNRTPAHLASGSSHPRALEVLCAAGVDLRACGATGRS